jgi:hypothetical protein
MEILQINLVSTLKWNTINEDCQICNNPIGACCSKCTIDLHLRNPINCLSITNCSDGCKHSFHSHCLKLYHNNNSLKCPICINPWITVKLNNTEPTG